MTILTLKEVFLEDSEMNEVAVSPEEAESGNLAIFLVRQPGAFMAVIYNPNEFDEYITNPGHDDRFIKGMIRSYKNEYCLAYEVKTVAALRGYGPMLYQLLSSRIGWIVSDRREVTEMAENIWKWMYNHPQVWMKEKLMEVNEAKTPLDYRYKWLKTNPSFNKMVGLNETTRKLLAEKHNISVKEINDIIVKTAEKFFDKRFF